MHQPIPLPSENLDARDQIEQKSLGRNHGFGDACARAIFTYRRC